MSFTGLLNTTVTVTAKSDTGATIEAWVTVATGKRIRMQPIKGSDFLPAGIEFDINPTETCFSAIDSTFSHGRRISDGTNTWQIIGEPLNQAGSGHHQKFYVGQVA